MWDFADIINGPWDDSTALYSDEYATDPHSHVFKDFRILGLLTWIFIIALIYLDNALTDALHARRRRLDSQRGRKSPFDYVFLAGGRFLQREPCPRKNYITDDPQEDGWRAEKRRRIL